MNRIYLILLGAVLLASPVSKLHAQSNWRRLPMHEMLSKDTISRKGYTLIFLNKDSALDPTVKKQLIETFFTVYPQEAQEYNAKTATSVIFFVDPGYKGVAATSDGIVRFNPGWFHHNPEDIDVVTHEVMHIVQDYGQSSGPGWLTEGIADYVRYQYGVNNAAAHWTLPEYKAGQSYTNAYRITARFLAWLKEKKNKDIVRQLDAAMRGHTYTDDLWKQLTGHTLDELWNEYAQTPAL